MNKTIAVEDNLRAVKNYLVTKGCRLVDVEEANKHKVDAVIISGCDENLMNMQDIVVHAPVINASGLSPEEIWQRIEKF
ncbi:YkuS family protein [Thermosyntropha sp.]|uniref:YkuS family protein n=1 Tax=Thermosyntropha sp. TaxID=2740820 RepID=UPI0025E90EE3|nr:YkuS family protein [Thermosyntropha sp.]MBO8158439.1 YkuS family protein [Thermosyntropha sp.]